MKIAVLILTLTYAITSIAHIGRNKISHRWPHMLNGYQTIISMDNSK